MSAIDAALTPRRWAWRPAVEPIAQAQAAIAQGEAARALLRALAGLPPTRREDLRLSAAADWLVVLGNPETMPWVDGIRYAAPAAQAPMLWLPTHVSPDVDAGLVFSALKRRHGRTPLLLWSAPEAVLPLDRAQPADEATLRAIAGRWGLPTEFIVAEEHATDATDVTDAEEGVA